MTFPEGFALTQIAQRLEENGVCSAADFIEECGDTAYLDLYGIEIDNVQDRSFLLEGYLYPDTYDFYIGENVSSVVKKFLNNTKSKLSADMYARCEETGHSMDEILTLASIIEKETFYESEKKNVSSVLHNRLRSPSFPSLQCDVTISYLERYVKEYVSEERYDELKLLYNTYKCKGLPAGPIANSSISSVEAALDPANTSWYYFVTDSDKNYYYAETWQQHVENCKKAGIE